MKTWKWVLVVLCGCIVWAGRFPTRVNAQVATGDIVGIVTDPTGSVVPNAAVNLRNINSGSTEATTTGADGAYSFSQLPPATYEITVTAAGFSRGIISQVVVRVGTRTTADIVLRVGDVATSVSVIASATAVKQDDIAVGTVTSANTIVELPLNGRNYLQLAQLAPGIGYATTNSPSHDWTGRSNLTLVVNGLHEADVSFLLDGIESRDPTWGNTGFRPSVDAIEEFNVQRSALTADQGVGLAVVNTVLRSGTDNFHGTVFEFVRNNDLNARNFFDYPNRVSYHQNNFGGTFGGPILKDRLFFFSNYEGYRQAQGGTTIQTFPTTNELNGVFPTTITDPTTGQPFPDNTIPGTRFDKIAKNVIPFFPTPTNTNSTNNFIKALSYPVTWDQGHFKMDINLPHNDRLSLRYSYVQDSLVDPGAAAGWGLIRPLGDQQVEISYTHIFTPTLVNMLRLGYQRNNDRNLAQGAYGSDIAKQIGLQNTTTTVTSFGLPGFGFTGISGIGAGGTENEVDLTNLFEISDNMSWHRGKHDIKFGEEIRRTHLFRVSDYPSDPSFSFNGQYTGNSIADFLLGFPSFFQWGIGDTSVNYENIFWAGYVQDNYKITSKLTMYMGLRYEYNQPPTEINNREGYLDLRNSTYQTVVANHLSRGMVDPDRNNFGPRLGFAYSPLPKTVIRAAGGVYYGLLPLNEDQFLGVLNPPFFYIGSISNTVPTPTYQLQNQFPSLSSAPTSSPNTVDPHDRTPYVFQYNFNLQHEFQGGFLVEAAYVGDHGVKLNRRFNANIADPGPTPLAQRRPYQGFSDILVSQNDGISNFNSLNLRVTKPMSHGILLDAAYTYGKELNIGDYAEYVHRDDVAGIFHDMKGPSEFDQRQRLTLNYVYTLPFGKGKSYLGNASGAVDKLVSGWQLTGLTTFASGGPQTANDNWSQLANIGARRQDPAICVGPLNSSSLRSNIRNNTSTNPALGPYFNIQNALAPANGAMGNCGKDMVSDPGLNNFDWALLKQTQITERVGIQFRAETFNIWNHAQFGPVDAGFADANYGKITSARDPREIQFGLKLIF